MNSFEKLKLRMQSSGNSQREEQINDARKLLIIENENDVSYCDTLVYWNTQTKVHSRLFERKNTNAYGKHLSFQTPIDEPVLVGDLLTDTSTNTNYLCVESYNDNVRYYGVLCETNWILKFQNELGEILSYPCFTSSERMSNDGNKTVQLGDAKKLVRIQYNSETAKLVADRRLYVDRKNPPTPYIIVGDTDTTTYNYGDKGIIEFIVEQTEASTDKDRPDLMICDYFTPTPTPVPTPTTKSYIATISCVSKVVRVGVDTKFTAVFKDTDGNIVNTLTPKWTITSVFDDKLTKTEGADYIEIGTKDKTLITETFMLKLEATDDSAEPNEISILIRQLF